ncbi:MAG TPA: UDP-N-acetylmuramoyl-L-alanine--D-glutamate ligase [Pirellulales bacterium]|nr:UDP-N-acetylmuramoyl-L-alanine--D-glutamate ligase [Pirellulales bacterium]
MDVSGRRVTVLGLGRHGGGVAAARWLARQGAVVTVTDLADEAALADSLAELADEPIFRYRLGGHDARDVHEAELVVVNPAVKPGNPLVKTALDAGAAITSETELFLARCPAHVVGVTGSNGKSTTAAMAAEILAADGRRVWLGGNIGRSLLDDLPRIGPRDWVVLELSSFQLWWLADGARWPETGVVTNCAPNHLDWHGSLAHYISAKQRLLARQPPGGLAVINPLDPVVGRWAPPARGRSVGPAADEHIPPLAVPGMHNRSNAACAAALAGALGCSLAAIERGLSRFKGLPHRLQFVGEVAGRRFYDDSMATTPESVMAAVDTLAPRGWFLVGGKDKGCDFNPLIEKLATAARGVGCFGAARDTLAAMLARRAPRRVYASFETMAEALAWCWEHSRADDSIALSPGCASHDQFRDYRHRGATFVTLVRALAARRDQVRQAPARDEP